MKDKLFFFGAFDPTMNDQFTHFPITSPLYTTKDTTFRTYTLSYMGKLTWRLNDKHQFESSVFGDPSHTSTSPWDRLTTYSPTANSTLKFGNRDWSVRYNGTLSPTWLVNISGTWGYNHLNETGFPTLNEVIDQTGPELRTATQTPTGTVTPQFVAQGRGFVENTEDDTYKLNADTSKTVHALGEHTFSFGFGYEKSIYKGGRQYSGGAVPLPGFNQDGLALGGSGAALAGTPANSEWYLRIPFKGDGVTIDSCPNCPLLAIPGAPDLSAIGVPAGFVPVYLRMLRSEAGVTPEGVKTFSTNSSYLSSYINDSWTPNKYFTLNLGARWDTEKLVGQAIRYTFVDNWSPRVGVIVDPTGTRKNKFYGNFARYNYNLPLDLAERSLTAELDVSGYRLAPDYTVNASGQRIATLNQYGFVTPIFDAAHVLNGTVCGDGRHCTGSKNVGGSVQNIEGIAPGTRDMYEDEWVVGYEHEFKYGIVVTGRFVRRDLKRIVEDTGGVSPEAANSVFQQVFLIANVSKNTDLFINPTQTEWVAATDALGNITNVPGACAGPFNAVNPDGSLTTTDFTSTIEFPVFNSLNQPVTTANGATAVCFGKPNFQTDASGNVVLDSGGNPIPTAGLAVSDGKKDGFVDPVRRYTAVELEVNKSFSRNWQLRANWRIARLSGNYEGALRNDNGQTDPGISSLFDFTAGDFNLLGNQFTPGVLNTDRLHIVNAFFTYVFDKPYVKGLQVGAGLRVQTGTPINRLAAHPIYLNAGEVPIGGRGSEGRTPTTGELDLHLAYPIRLSERFRANVGADFFNVDFAKRNQFVNQNIDLGFGVPNSDFLTPANQNGVRSNDAFQSPFNARFFVKLEF
jgi:hypothetical protein